MDENLVRVGWCAVDGRAKLAYGSSQMKQRGRQSTALRGALLVLLAVLLAPAALLAWPWLTAQIRPPPAATVAASAPSATPAPSATTTPTLTPLPTASATLVPTSSPTPTATPGPVEVGGRIYDAYIAAASKQQQEYKYSCEFDAAWVILQTYGIDASVPDLIALVEADTSVEPYYEETDQGFVIYGGDITSAFSGDYRENFLARSTGAAMRKAFEHYGLRVTPVADQAGVEAALRAGLLVWMKTTVDFKPWRPATWVMPDGRTRQTVLGNDHAVVVIGFSERGALIRDVLGPTSSNWERPYEYEVAWDVFLAAWGAQEFDGLAIGV